LRRHDGQTHRRFQERPNSHSSRHSINLDEPDPECDLDYVPRAARPHRQRVILSNSFGFGEQNASIVLRLPE